MIEFNIVNTKTIVIIAVVIVVAIAIFVKFMPSNEETQKNAIIASVLREREQKLTEKYSPYRADLIAAYKSAMSANAKCVFGCIIDSELKLSEFKSTFTRMLILHKEHLVNRQA